MTVRPLSVLSTRSFRAFTLIELLVVISIMALLMAILLPALQKAKESGEMAKCQSNVKQIAIAHLTYTQDFKSWWFASTWGTGTNVSSYRAFMANGGLPEPGFSGATPPTTADGGTYPNPTKPINPYANLPATQSGNSREVFELFECPGDTKKTLTWPCVYSTYGSIHPSFAAWYGTKFNHWGSSYAYIAGVGGWAGANDPYLAVPGHPELDIPYLGKGLWGSKVDDVKLPSLQVIVSDFHGAAWAQGAINGWGTDMANWLFHGHTEGGWARSAGSRLHNMGHVDGHVKTHDVPDGRSDNWGDPKYGTMSFNDEYRFYLETNP